MSSSAEPELGRRIDAGPGRSTFVQYIIANGNEDVDLTTTPPGLWRVMRQVWRALHEGDLTSFIGGLRREAWILSDGCQIPDRVDRGRGAGTTSELR
jgi:hypothetical protein